MLVQVVGSGCPKCKAVEKNVRKACARIEQKWEIEHVFDPKAFVALGVRVTPAVLLDGKIIFSGSVPEVDEIVEKLQERLSS